MTVAMTRAALAAVCLLTGCYGSPRPEIIDGDTFDLGTERIRLMGYDAPEIHPSRCGREYALGIKARDRLDVLLAGSFQIERHGHGKYGRTLAVVTVDGRDVADFMIAEGLARPYDGGRRQSWC